MLRVVAWGTYDVGKPRTRILLDGLREAGVEVDEIHHDLWAGVEDKSQSGTLSRLGVIVRGIMAYPGLIYRYLRAPAHDAVVVGYLGQFDVIILAAAARLRRRPIIWDMFISLYDTVVFDRRMVSPTGPAGRALRGIEWVACRCAARIIMDTSAHARYVERLFSLPSSSVGSVPVGAEPERFPRLGPPASGRGRSVVLFYGQLIPLHGIETILRAATSDRGRAFDWRIIGTGQDRPVVERFLGGGEAAHVRWEEWVPYERLQQRIADADVCLGIFGASEKAASVVPNKIYQSLLAGRSVVTRDSAAMRELVSSGTPGVGLVPPEDPDALLDAIAELEVLGFPQPPAEFRSRLAPAAIGAQLRSEIEALLSSRSPHEGHDV